ncbi:MAG: LytR/AlgR family response regulator transcription factor [Burkholderiales bacterium]
MSPRALIAEDEPLLAASLQAALAEAWPELRVIAVAGNGPAALEAAERERPEVVFLDIRMPGMSGLEVAEELADRLGDQVPAIVFVTAYDEYALKAFDAAAIDYVLKPIDAPRIARAVERLKKRLAERAGELERLLGQLRAMTAPALDAPKLRTLRAGSGSIVRMIPLEEVLYLQAADKYTRVVAQGGESLLRTAMRELLPHLPNETFRQIHRGTIVNLDAVDSATRDEQGRVSLKLKGRSETLAVSRLFADLFKPM